MTVSVANSLSLSPLSFPPLLRSPSRSLFLSLTPPLIAVVFPSLRYPLHSTTVIPCPPVPPVLHLLPPPHSHYSGIGAQPPPQPSPLPPPSSPLHTAALRQHTVPPSPARQCRWWKREVGSELRRASTRGRDGAARTKEKDGGRERGRAAEEKGDYVGRRKRGDKEATSNARRDEQDGRTRRLRMRIGKRGEERERRKERDSVKRRGRGRGEGEREREAAAQA